MRFYLKDFCIFINVAETGSLSQTAAIMGLSISSVSKRLARLEDHLQTTLFERNTRGVRLSPLGKEAYIKSKEITNAFSSFIDDIRGSKVLWLNVQVEKSIRTIPFIDWVYDYASASTEARVKYKSTLSVRSQPLNINDLVISPVKSSWPLAIHRKLEPVKRKIFASSGYSGDVSQLSLDSSKVIFYSEDEEEQPLIFNQQNGEEARLSPVMITDDISQIISLSGAKDIIIVGLPSYLSKKYEDQGLIHEIMPEWSAKNRQYYLIWKNRKYYNDEFSNFLDFLESKFSDFILN